MKIFKLILNGYQVKLANVYMQHQQEKATKAWYSAKRTKANPEKSKAKAESTNGAVCAIAL